MTLDDFDKIVIKYYKVNADYVRKERKEFKRIKKGFIKYIACKGYFDKVLTKSEIRKARKKGVIPEYLDIHHIIPLSGGGSSEFKNLVVVTKSTHKFINKNFFQPQLSRHLNDPLGSVYEIVIPIFNTHVDTGRIIQYQRELQNMINKRNNYQK